MSKCNTCKKEFPCESKLKRHKARKTPCLVETVNLHCDICNIDFRCKSEKDRHELTIKHKIKINNMNITNMINTANCYNSINNVINPMHIFSEPDMSVLYKDIINREAKDIIKDVTDNQMYNRKDENKPLNFYKNTQFGTDYMKYIIGIFKTLYFDKTKPQNNSCKIVSIDGDKPGKIIYLILETKNSNQCIWTEISYENLLNQIYIIMDKINTYLNSENFDKMMNHINTYIKDNEHIQKVIKNGVKESIDGLAIEFKCHNLKEIEDSFKEGIKVYNGTTSTFNLIEND